MDAAIDGGFNLVEFTLTTPSCLDRVAEYRAKYDGLKTGKVIAPFAQRVPPPPIPSP